MKRIDRTRLQRWLGWPLVALALVCLAGCTSLSSRTVAYIGATRSGPSDPAQIEILQTDPSRPHDKLGEVVVDASISPSPPVEKIEARLRRDAAKLGADALVLVRDQTETVGAVAVGPWWSYTMSPIQGRVIVAVAIKYK